MYPFNGEIPTARSTAVHVCDGVRAVSDLWQLQGALARAWRGAAREEEGVRPFVSADRKDRPTAGYIRNVYGRTDSSGHHLVRRGSLGHVHAYVRM